VLLSVHTFFDALGGEEIRKRGAREDKPLRMVKTVLHELCKLKVGALVTVLHVDWWLGVEDIVLADGQDRAA